VRGWVRNLIRFYEARELVGFDRFLHVQAWLDRGLARLAVQRGLQVTAAASRDGLLEVELTWRGVIRERRRIETMTSVRRPTKESRP
jgi:hypothetical protein